MKKSPLCWWCDGRLVGPGGVAGREPLSFREVEIQGGTKVKVHVVCAKETEWFVNRPVDFGGKRD